MNHQCRVLGSVPDPRHVHPRDAAQRDQRRLDPAEHFAHTSPQRSGQVVQVGMDARLEQQDQRQAAGTSGASQPPVSICPQVRLVRRRTRTAADASLSLAGRLGQHDVPDEPYTQVALVGKTRPGGVGRDRQPAVRRRLLDLPGTSHGLVGVVVLVHRTTVEVRAGRDRGRGRRPGGAHRRWSGPAPQRQRLDRRH